MIITTCDLVVNNNNRSLLIFKLLSLLIKCLLYATGFVYFSYESRVSHAIEAITKQIQQLKNEYAFNYTFEEDLNKIKNTISIGYVAHAYYYA